MNRFVTFVFLVPFLFGSLCCFAQETDSPKIPRFVLGPPGKTELMAYKQIIDNPEAWKNLRPHVGALLFSAGWLDKQYPKDEDLKNAMAKLRKLDVPIEFEVGALKEWAKSGEATYNAQTKTWDRLIRCGADVRWFSMDEPFINAREHMKVGRDIDMEFAANETVEFMERVRKNYPNIMIGDIEGYPFFSPDEMIQWIDLLQAKLKERGVKGMDFFRIDINVPNFIVSNTKENWHGVRKIEMHCKQIGLPFSVIYWAPDYGNPRFEGRYDDRTWYVGIMKMAYDYNLWNGGDPDQFVIESWVGGPEKTLPESDPFSFVGSALDFVERFVVEKPKK